MTPQVLRSLEGEREHHLSFDFVDATAAAPTSRDAQDAPIEQRHGENELPRRLLMPSRGPRHARGARRRSAHAATRLAQTRTAGERA